MSIITATTSASGPVTIQAVTKNYFFGDELVAVRQGSEVYFIHGDHLGSTSLTTDASGAVVAEARYLPYGEERWSNGEGVTDFGFTSQRTTDFGLMDYRARYYSPILGRFISPDTIVPSYENPQGLNRYAYALGNPLKYRDPSGYCVENGDETCWSLYEQIQLKYPEYANYDKITTADGIVPLKEASYARLRQQLEYLENPPVYSELVGEECVAVCIAGYPVSVGIVHRGADNRTSKTLNTIAFAMDTVDFGITGSLAAVGIVGSAITGEPLPAGFAEAANQFADLVTVPADFVGLGANFTADVLAGRTGFEREGGQFTAYIGTDTVASVTSLIMGGANPDVFSSAVVDTAQFAWDIARLEDLRWGSVQVYIQLWED